MQSWFNKFRNAAAGVSAGITGQSSFVFHLFATAIVILLAWGLKCEAWQWAVLLLCISSVLSLELLNSSLEHLARGLCHEQNKDVGRALDIAAGAVLVASIFAAIIGLIVLLPSVAQFLNT